MTTQSDQDQQGQQSMGDPLGLRRLEGEYPSAQGEGDTLFAALGRELQAETGLRARLRSLPTPRRWGLVLAVAAGVAAASFLLAGRVDAPVYPAWRLVFELLGIAVLTGVAGWVALRPLHRPTAPSWLPRALLGAAVGLPLLLALLPMAHDAQPESLGGLGTELWPRAIGCLLYGAICGLPLVGVLVGVSRTELRPGWRMATGLACAGLAGLFALQVHCPITQPPHLQLGHGPVVLALLTGGLLVAISVRRR